MGIYTTTRMPLCIYVKALLRFRKKGTWCSKYNDDLDENKDITQPHKVIALLLRNVYWMFWHVMLPRHSLTFPKQEIALFPSSIWMTYTIHPNWSQSQQFDTLSRVIIAHIGHKGLLLRSGHLWKLQTTTTRHLQYLYLRYIMSKYNKNGKPWISKKSLCNRLHFWRRFVTPFFHRRSEKITWYLLSIIHMKHKCAGFWWKIWQKMVFSYWNLGILFNGASAQLFPPRENG